MAQMKVNRVYQGVLVQGDWAGERCKLKYLGPSEEYHGPGVNKFEVMEDKEWPESDDPEGGTPWKKGDIFDLTDYWELVPLVLQMENK